MDTLSGNWKRGFSAIWTGQALSQFSNSIFQFAIVWYLADKVRLAMVLTVAVMTGLLPQGILGPFIGAFTDRYNRKRITIVSDLFISAANFTIVVTGWMGGLTTEPTLMVLLPRSTGSAFHMPCLRAVAFRIVPSNQPTRCAGYSQALELVSQILSPVMAAVLYSSWSLSGVTSLDVVGMPIVILALGITEVPQLMREGNGERIWVLREAEEGFLILKTRKGMLGPMLIDSIYILALMPTSALFPLMTMSYFHGTNAHTSIVEVVLSVGLLFDSLILLKWGGTKNRIYTIALSFLLMSFSLLASGLLPPEGFYASILCSWLMGVSGPFYWGVYTPLLQSDFGAEHLGQVLFLSNNIRLLSGPVGLVISGAFAENYEVEKWFLIVNALVLSASILYIAVPAVRACDDTEARNNTRPSVES